MMERRKPINWPEGVPLPNRAEVEKVVREGENRLRQKIDELEAKQRRLPSLASCVVSEAA